MAAFRAFLQGLKPGEIGFCIASFGGISATLLARKSLADETKQREKAALAQWQGVGRHVDQLVSQGAPHEGLSTIRFYAARLRGECREALGIADATNDEVCDEWLRRRDRGCPEALAVEHVRLRLKRFWHSIETAALQRQAMLRTDPTLPTRAATTTAAHGSGGSAGRPQDHVLQDLLQGGMDKNQANDRLVHKT